jgi:hypothetical protein
LVLLLVLSKDDYRILVSLVQIGNSGFSSLVMKKIQKVNITVTYSNIVKLMKVLVKITLPLKFTKVAIDLHS